MKSVTLSRDCPAIEIPSGLPLMLPAGTEVAVTQSLGGTFTVQWLRGLARIEERNRDALGIETQTPQPEPMDSASEIELSPEELDKEVWAQLKSVYDPEIPVNIVDLGLVYTMQVAPIEGGRRVSVKMTLTAPGCGMGPTIANDAKMRCLTVPGITDAEVDLVWDPPWNQDMISEVGRMKLGMM